jgi:hypothetical protein
MEIDPPQPTERCCRFAADGAESAGGTGQQGAPAGARAAHAARDRNLRGEGRRALRQALSRPILDDIRAYLEAEQPKVLPKFPEGQATSYALSNWEALIRYCEDGDLEIDNNGG